MPLDRSYTILLVPDRDAKVKKIRVEHRVLVRAAIAAGIVVCAFVAMLANYFSVVGRVAENQLLRAENLELQNRWREAEQKFAHINAEMDRVKRLHGNLRFITQLNDPERRLGIGPLQGSGELVGREPPGVSPPQGMGGATMANTTAGVTNEEPAHMESDGDLLPKLDDMDKKVKAQEQEARMLKSYFEDQQALLSAVPSIWPTRGFITSDFAHRYDPYTGDKVMHEGMDIGAQVGTPVKAPADATVVFVGTEGGYGNVLVLDHGYGIKTRYGHLSRIDVKTGEKVKRGQFVAAVGNSGRSTGPHLHYEVRVNGVADNPRKFVLEE
ncbi:MAG: M23 family metallopeptidase [Deltaproteobacteria bacterium]|nr:M23 family metallopeptidase [Deltaproteobacteria bacterium]